MWNDDGSLQHHFDILQRHFDILQHHIDIWQRHMTSGSVIQCMTPSGSVWHCQMSYDAAIYLYDAAGCQNDAAKPHFEGSQDTWMLSARMGQTPSGMQHLFAMVKQAKPYDVQGDFTIFLYLICVLTLAFSFPWVNHGVPLWQPLIRS